MSTKFPSLYLLAAVAFLVASCARPETIVVNQNPVSSSPEPAQQTPSTDSSQTSVFRQLNIGELNRIPVLDPLYAQNASTMRTLQLVFEGLVKYNENGMPVPALAQSWSASDDSLSWRFHLRTDVYYHDSNAFETGVGRKFVASDVKYVFKRMASRDVPSRAARLFMDINGFEPYYREQHDIFNPHERKLKDIQGITAPNDSTVIFSLVSKDPHFLQKLATPYALIYPKEAVKGTDPATFEAVGTGPFRLSEQRGDSLYIFAKNKNYYISGEPKLSRVDIRVSQNETALFQDLAKGDIHFIAGIGPEMAKTVLNEQGELSAGYTNNYTLRKPGGMTHYMLNYHAGSTLSPAQADLIAALGDSVTALSGIPDNFITIHSHADSSASNAVTLPAAVTTAYTNNIFARSLIGELNRQLKAKGSTLQMSDLRVPTRSTGLYVTDYLPLYPRQPHGMSGQVLLGMMVKRMALQLNSIKNLPLNSYPWWIDLRTTTLPGIDNL